MYVSAPKYMACFPSLTRGHRQQDKLSQLFGRLPHRQRRLIYLFTNGMIHKKPYMTDSADSIIKKVCTLLKRMTVCLYFSLYFYIPGTFFFDLDIIELLR
jgi:hypothetical protein